MARKTVDIGLKNGYNNLYELVELASAEDDEGLVDEILEECDNAFFDYEDDLNELNYNFVMKNKEAFI